MDTYISLDFSLRCPSFAFTTVITYFSSTKYGTSDTVRNLNCSLKGYAVSSEECWKAPNSPKGTEN